MGRYLERQGLPKRDAKSSYLASDAVDEDAMAQLLGHCQYLLFNLKKTVGRRVQDTGFAVQSKNRSFTQRLSGYCLEVPRDQALVLYAAGN